jgi:hypothetical protein
MCFKGAEMKKSTQLIISIPTLVVSALKKLLYRELSSSRNPSGHFKPLLDPGGGFNSETETAARRFKKRNGR